MKRIIELTAGFVFITACVVALLLTWLFSAPLPPQGWGGCPEPDTFAAGLDATGKPTICVPFKSSATP
jgi:hypothetical protein